MIVLTNSRSLVRSQAELAEPAGQWVLVSFRSRREIRDGVTPNLQCWIEASDCVVKIRNDLGIGVRESRRFSGEATLGNEVSDQPDLGQLKARVRAEAVDRPRYRNAVSNDHIVERLPTPDRHERMVTSNFDRPTRPSRDLEAWLDAAVDPSGNVIWLDTSI